MFFSILLIAVLILGILYWKRVKNLPLHSDTAEFLYPGLVVALKQKFEPYRILSGREWWSGTFIALAVSFWWGKKKKPLQLEFPPEPYCELNNGSPPVRGGNPTVQQKMAVYFLFQFLGRIFTNFKTDFRILQTVIILCISVITYGALACYTTHIIAVGGALFILVLLTLPFFDTYQIHAELYGTLALLFAFRIISSNAISGIDIKWIGLIVGLILVFITIFVKITFVSDAFVFLFYPLFVSGYGVKLSLVEGEFAGLILVLFVFSCTHYFMKLIQILDPVLLMKYRRQMLSMHENTTSNQTINNNNTFNGNSSRKINWFYLHFNMFFNIGFICFIVFGILVGLYLHSTLFSLYGFLFLWVLISLAVLKFQNKFYAAHFIPPLVPIILLWGVTIHDVLHKLHTTHGLIGFDYAAIYGLLFCLVLPFLVAVWTFFKYVVKAKPSAYFLTSYMKRENPHLLQLLAAPSIGEYIKKNSLSSDRIFCFGYANTVYLYAQRRASLEFLEGCLGIDPEITDSIFDNRWKWWICRDIHKFKPKYIVDMDGRLNIDAINDSTGLRYALDHTFYQCFHIYIQCADSTNERFGGNEKIDNLVIQTSQAYRKRIAFNEELFTNHDRGYEHLSKGLSELLTSWQKSVDKSSI